jgi:hypothetical protein
MKYSAVSYRSPFLPKIKLLLLRVDLKRPRNMRLQAKRRKYKQKPRTTDVEIVLMFGKP